mgnify:CR=1 FL=1
MKGKSYSIPAGMVFKKYYCSHCGAKLVKSKTHRVVSKDDKDYYRYHNYGTFPRRDYDVYDYRFKCPDCGARISYDEQCIIERIQKKQGHTVLSSSEIKSNYSKDKKGNHKRVLLKSILIPIVFVLIAFSVVPTVSAVQTDQRSTCLPEPCHRAFPSHCQPSASGRSRHRTCRPHLPQSCPRSS